MNWKEYYQKETVKALTETFESNLTKPQIIADYNKLYNKITRFKGSLEIKALERYTYEIMVGLRPQLPATPHDFKQEYVWRSLAGMATQYDEILQLLLDYSDKKITLKGLNKRIKDFKKTNLEYLQRYKS